jgi:hypothetical protein
MLDDIAAKQARSLEAEIALLRVEADRLTGEVEGLQK